MTAKGFSEGISIVRVWHEVTQQQERDLFLRFQSVRDEDWIAACKRIIHSAFPPKLPDWERYVGEIVGSRSTASPAPVGSGKFSPTEAIRRMAANKERVPKVILDIFDPKPSMTVPAPLPAPASPSPISNGPEDEDYPF